MIQNCWEWAEALIGCLRLSRWCKWAGSMEDPWAVFFCNRGTSLILSLAFFPCAPTFLSTPPMPKYPFLWFIISLIRFSSSSYLCPMYTMTSLTWDHVGLSGGNNYSGNNWRWKVLSKLYWLYFLLFHKKVFLTLSTIELTCDSIAVPTVDSLRNQAKSPTEFVLFHYKPAIGDLGGVYIIFYCGIIHMP
jgi:hypothetical protein